MPSYIMLMKWTQAGIQQIKDDAQRIERLRNILTSINGELKAPLLHLRKVRQSSGC